MPKNSVKALNFEFYYCTDIFSCIRKVEMKIPTNKKKNLILTKDPRLIFISQGNKLSPLRINGGRQHYRTESAGNLYSSVASANY